MVPTRNMNTISLIFLVPLATLHTASADIPKKPPLVKYTGLWTNSPFTSKPVVEQQGTAENPLDDFTLTGIAPVPGGYRITIINKKNPEIKKIIEPGGSDTEFKVVSVDRNPGKTLGTTVVLSTGSMQGTVSFEPDLITLKAAPAAPQPGQPQPGQPQPNGLPPGVVPPQGNQDPNQPNGGATVQRQPRPRIVAPPTPSSVQQPATAPQGGKRDERTRRR